jgi:hypothetical protein
MGYSRKVEGSSFPMVVVSGQTTLITVRNYHLKIGIFLNENSLLMDNPLGFFNEIFTIYQSFEGP